MLDMAHRHMVAMVSVSSDFWLGCAVNTQSEIAPCIHALQEDAPLDLQILPSETNRSRVGTTTIVGEEFAWRSFDRHCDTTWEMADEGPIDMFSKHLGVSMTMA